MKNKCTFHVWKRYKKGEEFKDTVFMCSAPDCVYKTNAKALVGKRAICGLCFETYIIAREDLLRATPHCGCRNNAGEKENIKDLLEFLGFKKEEEIKDGPTV